MSSDYSVKGARAWRHTSAIDRAVEWVWARALSMLWRRTLPATRVADDARASVLVVAPHFDDESLGCGGVISLHVDRGDDVRVAIVTDGRGSKRATPDARAAESVAAENELGGSWIRFGLPEYEWSEAVLHDRLTALLARITPTMVYAPSCVDYHPEHIRVAATLGRALGHARSHARVRVFEIGVPLTPMLANRKVDLTGVQERKAAALWAYRSQEETIQAVQRLQRYSRWLYGAERDVEVFWEMSAAAYHGLMTSHPLPERAFRGVRYRPYADPLVYLAGRAARRQFRADAGASIRFAR